MNEWFFSIIFVFSCLLAMGLAFYILAPYGVLLLVKGFRVGPTTYVTSGDICNPRYRELCQLMFFKKKIHCEFIAVNHSLLDIGQYEFLWLKGKLFVLAANQANSKFTADFRAGFYERRFSWWQVVKIKWHTVFLMLYLLMQFFYKQPVKDNGELKQNIRFFFFYPFLCVFFALKNKSVISVMQKILEPHPFEIWKEKYQYKMPFYQYWFYHKGQLTT